MNNLINPILSGTSKVITLRDLMEVGIAALLFAILVLVSWRYPVLSARVKVYFNNAVKHVNLCVLAAMLLPLVIRLALLPWVPPPEPHVHDEFGHLLVADTLAAGRLANPPHPLWRHLETIYVLQQPTYASTYPIGQAIPLAIGKVLLGKPWAGVLLSVVLMSGAISWMLFGCLPPGWAAIGGLLAALQYGLAPRLVDSYWGGSFCAFGGALLFGALCRLRKSPSLPMALLVGLGWSIVWLIRPFESLLLLIIFFGLIAAFILREPGLWREWVGTIALIFSILIFTGGITALHNYSVTGSFTTLPYQLSQKFYGVPQSLLWQRAIEEPPLRFAELKQVYTWQLKTRERANERPFRQFVEIVIPGAWAFYVSYWYSLPILLLVFQLRDRWIILGCGILACVLASSMLYPFFFPHYIAAYSCIFVFLTLRGMMVLFQLSWRGWVVGRSIVLFLMIGGALLPLRIVPVRELFGVRPRQVDLRVQVYDRLLRFGGRHVVFVRYDANHSFHDEWVYNAANVDAAPIVWCRAGEPADAVEVTRYYKDRHFWIANVGEDRVRVSRYDPALQLGTPSESSEKESGDWVLERPPQRKD